MREHGTGVRPYGRGDASKGGNPNPRIALGDHGGSSLCAAISHRSEKTGHRQERDAYSEAPRVTEPLWGLRKRENLRLGRGGKSPFGRTRERPRDRFVHVFLTTNSHVTMVANTESSRGL